eukprot:4913045-Alexandrium_andersonii.AAC.1
MTPHPTAQKFLLSTILGRRQRDKFRGSKAHAAVLARFQRLLAIPLRRGCRPSDHPKKRLRRAPEA